MKMTPSDAESATSRRLLDKLQTLNEKDLVDKIIVPFLERLQFARVEVRHGPLERGTDILCVKYDELGALELLSVVVKRIRFSGRADSSAHLHTVLNQLSQSLSEPIALGDGSIHQAARVWFISPYPISNTAREASLGRIRLAGVERIRIVDGPDLLQAVFRTAPDLLAEIGDATAAYRKRLEVQIPLLHEAAVLGLTEKKPLSQFVVSLDVSLAPTLLAQLLSRRLLPAQELMNLPYQEFVVSSREATEWMALAEEARAVFGVSIMPRPPEQIRSRPESSPSRRQTKPGDAAVRVDMGQLYGSITTAAAGHLSRLSTLSQMQRPDRVRALHQFHDFTSAVTRVLPQRVVRDCFRIGRSRESAHPMERVAVDMDDLISSRLNLQVIGGAGAGKTTLLRLIAARALTVDLQRNPVFVPLSRLTSRVSLLGLIERSLHESGWVVSATSLKTLLAQGELIVLFDGLDEAASRIQHLEGDIRQFMADFPRTQTVVSGRPWATLDRASNALTIRLQPMTRTQVQTLIGRWFSEEPLTASELTQYLDEHEALYEVLATPLLATLFLTLKQSQRGSLPNSEVELYSERLRLHLHDWDAVRAVDRSRYSRKDKEFFLRKLAFEMHSRRVRALEWGRIVALVLETMGTIEGSGQAGEFVRELAQHNHVLFQEADGGWSLGHLQFQEHLVALELKENPRRDLLKYLGDDWWLAVMRMYSEMSQDIGPLVTRASRMGVLREHAWDISGLLEVAPNTPSRQRDLVDRALHSDRPEEGGMILPSTRMGL